MNDQPPRSRQAGGAQTPDDIKMPTPVFVLTAARRYWYLIALTTILAAVVGQLYGSSRPVHYDATASIYFSNTSLTDRAFGQGSFNSDPERRTATQIALIELPSVATRAANMLGAGWTTSKVSQSFSVAQGGQSDLVNVTAVADRPADAARIADAVVRAAIAIRNESARADSTEALELVTQQLAKMSPGERASATGQALQANRSRLQLQVASPGGDAEIAQSARVPSAPATASPWRLGILGALFGAALGLAIAILRQRIDPKISTQDQIRQVWPSVPILATMPDDRVVANGTFEHGGSPSLAPLLIARTSLRYLTPGLPPRVVGVTSALAGEGKSTIAWGLAAAAAAEGDRVVVIEGDLRAPSLVAARGIPVTAGVLGYLTGRATFDEVVSKSGPPSLPFDVVPAGGVEPAPVPLLRDARFEQLINEALSRYDIVIVDLPPVTLVPDALTVADHLDVQVVVVRMGHESPAQLIRARTLLSDLELEGNAPAFGIVVNRGNAKVARAYGAGVGYGMPTGRA